ncbi:MAG: S41 family peptidase [Ferruginibacter sp.]
MKLFLLAFTCFCISPFFLSAQDNEAYFLSNPCLTPDGQTVIFSYEGDLWKSGIKDGQAVRLTAMQGYETNPHVSPDGKWIAFSGRQYGNADIFVMPVNGGDIKQVTWHSSNDEVSGWSWDSQSIYFTSSRFGQAAGFKVSANGGTPKRVFGNYFFQYDHNLAEHPLTGEIFFNDTWESSFQVQRKRYQGPFNPDIQSYNPTTHKYQRYTTWEGKDFGATIDKKGNVYFISDEANNEYNLYSIANGKKTALTTFSSSIKTPAVSSNGEKIVFEKDYQLWLYDVATKKPDKLSIHIFRNSILTKEKDYDVKSNISAFDISPDAKKMAFISRGELFVSDIEGKFIQIINRGSGERVREVKWLSDNKTLLFNQTLGGYTNFYTIGADGSAALKQVTTDQRNNRALMMNKKRTSAVYLSGRDEVRLLDTKSWENKTVVKDEIWGFQGSNPGFSPEGDYVIFTAYRNFEQDVFVYNIKDNKTTNLTKTAITEVNPLWSPDGKYIYLASQRLKPGYPFGLPDAKIYRLPLEQLDEPYRIDKYNELFKEEKKDTTQKKDTTKKKDTAKVIATPVVIDTARLMERMELIGPLAGRQMLSYVYQKGEKTSVLFSSDHGEGRDALWKTVIEPFEQNKTEKIAGMESTDDFDIVEVSDKLFVLSKGTISKLNLEANKTDPISISYTFRRNLSAEFDQMFYEAWAQLEENYYDEKFHGLEWEKTKNHYKQFLPYLNNRADLRILLNDMLGELNSSHQGFGTFGDDEAIVLTNRTMETGIIFKEQEPYTVQKIVRRSVAERKGIDVKPGDVLVKVNDEQVQPGRDRNYYFTKPSVDKELKMTFSRNGKEFDVKIHPQTSLYGNLYDEWIDDNRQRVNEKSKGRIAYGYMKNMGRGELEHFITDMTQELGNRDALIFDLRYNTGGNVHDEVLNFLSQRSYLQWKYREGKPTPQPNFAPSDKPIILLTNEQSLSDAEMTANGFKALKLGKIVGNETYHWIIFTSGVSLVDNSSVRIPAWGCYTLDGKDLEKTGVQPDVRIINTFEDKLTGKDPQLDRAIEEILKQLK